jgi:death on curing protein
MAEMLFLRKAEVLELQKHMIAAFGGAFGIRDEGALESAIAAPQQRAYYEEADVVLCCATYIYHLCQAHAFIDGNKRVASAAAELFLELNDARLNASDDELIDLILRVADSQLPRNEVERIITPWVVLNHT